MQGPTRVEVEYVPEKPDLTADNPLLLGAFASVEKFSLTDHTAAARVEVPGITDLGLMPRKVSKVAIVGGGLMGSGIATALILSHYPVILKEVDEKFLNVGIDRIKVVENVKLKQQIFAELEQHRPSHCILATNTSTIDLNLIGEKTNSQDRIVGTHFFVPAHIMPLLEIVRTPRASLQAVVTLLDVGKKIKKIPIVVGNCTGFTVQKGFYRYEGKRKASPDLEIMNYVEESRRIAGATPDPELLKLDNSAIAEMVFFPIINEACRVLGEGITFKASDLDIASIFGMGFPPYRGGIMYWADSIGARCICTMLSKWEMKYGQFFKPCSYLLERAAGGLPLSTSVTRTMNQGKDKL
ncbi:Glyoxysomal fatty acid beta-oxidation multifunctional protein MFP-a [Hordeum vulgare]|nr:Glyoxysomal fatty acid beta-oxidation multifunctional protein MFP-a [Hordeum vulgare]